MLPGDTVLNRMLFAAYSIAKGVHEALIFRVELTTITVRDRPDRSDRFTSNVERNQKAFFNLQSEVLPVENRDNAAQSA